jgi:hypothetical protein
MVLPQMHRFRKNIQEIGNLHYPDFIEYKVINID